ncbi:MAG: aldolase [Candidatus Marinimicrobia bacterium]|nr:aldolase [Candidatus Neomarinimicrobiota bacterium]
MIKPYPSRVLRLLREGQDVLVHKMNLTDPKGAEIAALCGVDCLWLDMEHGGLDLVVLENLVRAAKLHGADTMVRVRRGSYSDLLNPLEADATGIMVPHVKTAAEAREIVRTVRFQPVGRRPLDGGTIDGMYTMIPVGEYLRHANEDRFVVLQIEDPEAIEELEAIAAIEGYNALLLGPGDMSHGLGEPGNMDHPVLKDLRVRFPDICRKHGKVAGTTGGTAQIAELRGLGYRIVAVSSDIGPIIQSCREAVRVMGAG